MIPAAPAAADIAITSLLDGDDAQAALAADVRAGLTARPKELKPKYFYDERGSELFDRITELPEYYPTRCERAILNRFSPDIVAATAAVELVELGSGSASKTRALLYAMAGAGTLRRYVPFDVDRSVVERSAEELTELYPGLSVRGVVGDFERHLDALPPRTGPRIVAFLGGTIGNLAPGELEAMMERLGGLLEPGDHLLLGADLVKDRAELEAAYDDAAGVTAAFNRNVLAVLNRELGGDFDLEAFEHVARFDARRSWVEMRLRAGRAQRVRLAALDLEVEFSAGEEMRTEISTKFTRARLAELLAAGGMSLRALHTDAGDRFSVTLAAPA